MTLDPDGLYEEVCEERDDLLDRLELAEDERKKWIAAHNEQVAKRDVLQAEVDGLRAERERLSESLRAGNKLLGKMELPPSTWTTAMSLFRQLEGLLAKGEFRDE